jgi:phage tail-like protein
MRAALPGLASPHPLGARLPAVFVDDDFTQRLLSAFDTVLAPLLATLDCLDAYLDPAATPPDFLAWLAGWLALELAEEWPEPRQRELVRQAIALHRWRGTRRGVAEQVRLVTGGEVEVADSGGCGASPEPGGDLPGTGPAAVRVTVRVADPAAVDRRRLAGAVAAAVPAHVSTTVEVTGPL